MSKNIGVMPETHGKPVARGPQTVSLCRGRAPYGSYAGGVAEYLYQREARDFGDMGPRLDRRFPTNRGITAESIASV